MSYGIIYKPNYNKQDYQKWEVSNPDLFYKSQNDRTAEVGRDLRIQSLAPARLTTAGLHRTFSRTSAGPYAIRL